MPEPTSIESHRLATRLEEALRQIRRAKGKCPAAGPDLAKAIRILGEIRERLEAPSRRGDGVSGRGPRRASTVKFYRVEETAGGPCLAEYRSSRAQPFLCPKPVFDATVRSLARASGSVKAKAVFESVDAELRRRTPEYLPRLVLRFLVAAGLVHHQRARFRPFLPPRRFEISAARAWATAARQPVPAGNRPSGSAPL